MTPDSTTPTPAGEISELLLLWRQRREQGQSCAPEELCPDRPDLHEELQRRIDAIQSMEGKLLPGTKSTLPLKGPRPAASPLPQAIAGYEIVEELGRGGMGVVYKARQKGLNRLVALKMILAGAHAGPHHRQRFQAEAEALARLRHPNIVQVYEAGEADGLPFLSLEYIEGGGLDRRLESGPLPPGESAALVEALAQAVQAAHDAGIVHRDLKPANVLLASGGREPPVLPHPAAYAAGSPTAGSRPPLTNLVPKITDFGLAKMIDAEGRTQSGDVLGTPAYMAPEQAAGRIKDVGPSADIYALGAILYQCLAGSPPFNGQTTVEVLLQVTSAEPVPPSRHRQKVPHDLETICLKCLEKTPARRYATAGDLADDLRRFLDGLPIMARRVGVVERGFKWVKRRPERAMLLGFLLLLPLVFFLFRPGPGPAPPAEDLPSQARAILLKYCFPCHGQDPEHLHGDLAILDPARLLDAEEPIVVPGDVKGSRLIERIEDGSMPPDEKEEYPRLSSDEVKTLKSWVMSGASLFPGPEPADFRVPPVSPLAVQVHELFQKRCHQCHRVGNAKNGVKVLNHDLLVVKRTLVVPGRPDESPLFRLLVPGQAPKRMPPPPRQSLDEKEIDLVRRWITEGAPAFPLPPMRREPREK